MGRSLLNENLDSKSSGKEPKQMNVGASIDQSKLWNHG